MVFMLLSFAFDGKHQRKTQSQTLRVNKALNVNNVPVIWAHSTVDHTNVLRDHFNFVDALFVIQD